MQTFECEGNKFPLNNLSNTKDPLFAAHSWHICVNIII